MPHFPLFRTEFAKTPPGHRAVPQQAARSATNDNGSGGIAMSKDKEPRQPSRRDFIHAAGASAALLGGLGFSPALAADMAKETARSEKPLRAAFSNAGLQATWCAQG